MRENKVYLVSVTVSSTNEIHYIICSCPYGAVPATCKHAFVVLYGLQDYSQQKLYSAPQKYYNYGINPNHKYCLQRKLQMYLLNLKNKSVYKMLTYLYYTNFHPTYHFSLF